jgi:hypothetical protein
MKRRKIEFTNWKVSNNSIDNDCVTYFRAFSGRMTKARLKTLSSIARRLNIGSTPYCGCAYDCCGHKCSQYASLNYSKNRAVITVSEGFNY